jgi:hypothetical protein
MVRGRCLVKESEEPDGRPARGFSAVRWTWHPRACNGAADLLVRELLWGSTGCSS